MNVEKIKLAVEVATPALAVLGGLVALFQWRRDQGWKRAEKLDDLYREFQENRLIQIACRVLDWTSGSFTFPGGETFSFKEEDVAKSLVVHGEVEDLKFTATQVRMRDSYDAILAFFDRLEAAIAGGLVDRKNAGRLFGYWVSHFSMMPEHPECLSAVNRYILQYASMGSFSRLRGMF